MHSVLLIVDDEQLRATLVPLLSGLGYDVVSFRNAAEARGDDVELVLVDLNEDRISQCVEDAVKLRELFDVPIILLTPSLDEHLLARTTDAAASGFVLKPILGRELASAFELALFRRRAEKEAAARERWYKTTLRSIADAIITADDGARITFMNPTAELLTGWTEAEALGRPLNDVFAVEAETGNDKGHSDPSAQPVLRLATREGATLVIEHNAAPIIEDVGMLYGVVVVFRDITERRRIEHRLALSDRMASIGTLAAGIAHELNNPLAFVTSNLEFAVSELVRLKEELGDGKPDIAAALHGLTDAVEALREARDGASRAAHIVKDMKIFMRAESDGNLFVDVNRAVALAVRLTSNEIRHKAELETNLPDVPSVLADEGKLVQVLVNVLTNAVQALDEKSHHKITIVTALEDCRVVIRITDTGRGIAPEHLGRIFEPFFTTKPVGEGLGLGLSIAHTIITGFGGTVIAESSPSTGTTISISLPTSEVHAKVTPAARSRPAIESATRGRVLVVDDEALIGTAIRRILTKHGIDVVVEAQGKAAFDRLAAGERYDVVLCDLMMPGFSGVDLYEGLDDVAPEMKSRVVFMTGNAFTPRANELFENTRNVRLEKPFVPSDLTRAVTEVMNRHGAKVEI